MRKITKTAMVFLTLILVLMGLLACKGKTQTVTTTALPQKETVEGENPADVGKGTDQRDFEQNKNYSINIVAINGPTGMGMAYLNKQSDEGKTEYKYTISYSSTPDEVVSGLTSGEIDIAAVPVNLASVLYNKTEGDVLTIAVNTLGVLYIVETGDVISNIMDLEGKHIIAGGQGSTPEYILGYILEKNGLTDKVDIEFVSEHDEAIMALASEKTNLIMIPEPKVTATLSQVEGSAIALDLTEEWGKVSDTELVQGGLVVRKGFLEKYGEEANNIINAFIKEYKESVDFTVNNAEEASEIIAEYGILPKAAVALKAIPNCNIVCLTNEDMEKSVTAMLKVLYEANPKSVGGCVPDGNMFYYVN